MCGKMPEIRYTVAGFLRTAASSLAITVREKQAAMSETAEVQPSERRPR